MNILTLWPVNRRTSSKYVNLLSSFSVLLSSFVVSTVCLEEVNYPLIITFCIKQFLLWLYWCISVEYLCLSAVQRAVHTEKYEIPLHACRILKCWQINHFFVKVNLQTRHFKIKIQAPNKGHTVLRAQKESKHIFSMK